MIDEILAMPDSLAEGRSLLEVDVPAARRKQLGQCFTGLRTGRLLAALAVRSGCPTIVDPMAGHGDLLEAAAERAWKVKLKGQELFGVEIEPASARLGRWRVQQSAKEFGFSRASFLHGDAFEPTNWTTGRRYDVVIVNPPYVRYQTCSLGGADGDTKLQGAEAIRRALMNLASDRVSGTELEIWKQLISSYSGLADLSVPSWLLCGLLTAPGGMLALVVPNAWLKRDYARLVRYFFLRFFEPVTIVQESGQRWFEEASVPVSLVVGRRLAPEEANIPLLKRQKMAIQTPYVEIGPEAGTSMSHVGKAFPGKDPEGAFARWLMRGDGERSGIVVNWVNWSSQRDEVLYLARETKWLKSLEELPGGAVTVSTSQSVLPAELLQQLPPEVIQNVKGLSSEGIRVGQGLRTGCNAFFYAEDAGDPKKDGMTTVITDSLFGSMRLRIPSAAVKPVLRKQSELTKVQIMSERLRGRLLDLRYFVLPENADPDMESCWQIMPRDLAAYVRLAARTYLVRGQNKTLIPDLSAVRTNGRGPHQNRRDAEKDPGRMWYMIPDFAPRHRAEICIPRIIHEEPFAFYNANVPVLIDANFSTLWFEGDGWNGKILLGVLNSKWGELCMEGLGATLGGGALKLEATHLRQFPLPGLRAQQKQEIENLVSDVLSSEHRSSEFKKVTAKIDRTVMSALTRRSLSEAESESIVGQFEKMVDLLRSKRRTNRKN